MKVFCISDLHLPGNDAKPMDIFGDQWANHWGKIQDNWERLVSDDDLVLISGDISWAMNLENAIGDLEQIGSLPGEKIMIRGNHDYWWNSISRVRSALPSSIYALQNDSVKLKSTGFCGTRGWAAPGIRDYTAHDQKIFDREINRLKMSLDSAKAVDNIIVLLHYPPFDDKGEESEMVELIRQYPVSDVIFGHLHGDSLKGVIEGKINGLCYHLASCDYLNFTPKFILEIE